MGVAEIELKVLQFLYFLRSEEARQLFIFCSAFGTIGLYGLASEISVWQCCSG